MNNAKQIALHGTKIFRKRTQKQSNDLSNKAHDMASVIPAGQPILIGHHSEKRDRAYREKIGDTYRKSREADEKSEYYANKAVTVESNDSISSDDPKALEKLKAKLAQLEKRQSLMKTVNKVIFNKKQSEEQKIGKLMEHSLDEEKARTFIAHGAKAFQHFELSNNNQNMARIRKRIKLLELRAKVVSKEVTINGVRVCVNVQANRIQMFFQGKPCFEVRDKLKRRGFRWSPREGV